MEARDLAAKHREAVFFGALLAVAVAGMLCRGVRAIAAEPLPHVSTVVAPSAGAAHDGESWFLREPSDLRPALFSDLSPVFFVAQRDGPMRDDSAGNAASGAGASTGPALTSGSPNSISGNPGASNVTIGSGWLGDYLGINRNGWRFAGLNITDANGLSGGLVPGWTSDSLTIADISIDTAEAMGWENGQIGMEFLYYSGGPVNSDAGTVMGYNSLDVVPPDNRAELYQLWYLHKFLNDRLLIRIGKTVTTYDFNNVVRTIPYGDTAYDIAAVSSLIFTPLYISPTQLGVVPGYYNSVVGVTTTLIPFKDTYINYGLYDGNLANGRQTGLEGPHFNGYALHMVEVGCNWTIGARQLPGKFGAGYWAQTGELQAPSGSVDGAQGMYFFGSQRLFYEHPGESNEGMSMFYQFAATDSDFVETHRYFGFGLTYFGPLPGRDGDSAGWGLAYGQMNDNPAADLGADEVILSWYYQWMVSPNCFLQPNLTYIPNPAAALDIPGAFPITLRAILLF